MSGPISPRAAELPITARQIEVLEIIARSLEERGFPPTYRELTLALGISPHSRQTIHEHLAQLEAKRLLIKHRRAARGITLTPAARELLERLRLARAVVQASTAEPLAALPIKTIIVTIEATEETTGERSP